MDITLLVMTIGLAFIIAVIMVMIGTAARIYYKQRQLIPDALFMTGGVIYFGYHFVKLILLALSIISGSCN